MTETNYPVNHHKAYHAHVYYDADTKDMAKSLCDEIGERFPLRVGRLHLQLVGPHPMWSCQITFGTRDFDTFIPWLDENRKGLSVLVHGLTGDDLKDHTDYAYWLGQRVPLNLEFFSD